MRIKLFFSPNTEVVEEELTTRVIKSLHVCLGNNNKWHDGQSPYSISQLHGGVMGENGHMQYPDGCWFVVSSQNEEFLNDFIGGMFKHAKDLKIQTMNFIGYYVYSIEVGERFDNVRIDYLFFKIDDKPVTFKDERFLESLEDQCIRKLKACGCNDDDFKTFKITPFHPENWKEKTCKLVHGVDKVSVSPCSRIMLTVKGKREVREKLYHLGIGNLTGCAFGFVKMKKDNVVNKNLIINL